MMRRIRTDLAVAFGLMTRLPVGWLMPDGAAYRLERCGWCFPLVGMVVGGLAAAVLWLGATIGMPQAVAAAWSLGLSVLLTGGLHEDGLADTADGLGGGHTVERRLEIMRDSRIGSFGAVAIALTVAIRIAAVATLPLPRALTAVPCSAALSRFCILVVLAGCRAARRDGSGRAVEGPNAMASLVIGGGFAAALAGALFPWRLAVALLGLCVIAGMATTTVARRMVGGYTGDILGATAVLADCLVLSVLARR